MRLLGHQHHQTLATGRNHPTVTAFGQGIVQIGEESFVIEPTLEFGAHEETALFVVDELIVLDDIELMLVANVGDLGDQPFGVWAIGEQNLAFHPLAFLHESWRPNTMP